MRQSLLGQMVTSSPCPRCGGTGEEIPSPCPDCRGQGRRLEERSYTVEVPAGVDDGATLRLTGRGAAGPRGGAAGDLYLHLRVRPHATLTRDGIDLRTTLRVTMAQAALGAQLKVETLDGPEELTVPPGCPTGYEMRLRGQGVPHLQRRGRGDLLVTCVVDTPTELTASQEDLLRRFAAERGEEVAPRAGLPVANPQCLQVVHRRTAHRPPARRSHQRPTGEKAHAGWWPTSSSTTCRRRGRPWAATTCTTCPGYCGCGREKR